MMAKIVDEIVDINIFQDKFYAIDQNFLYSIVSIASLFNDGQNFLMMTKDSTFAYGDRICEMLSLKHDSSKPQKISLLNDMKIVQVDSGGNFVVLLTNYGHVYLASDGNWDTKRTFKLITVTNDADRFTMIACSESDLILLRQDGAVFESAHPTFCNSYGFNTCGAKFFNAINDLKNLKLIACGRNHCLALTNGQKLYSWGSNNSGQLGLDSVRSELNPKFCPFPGDSVNSRIKDIAAGENFSLFLLENLDLYFCGEDFSDNCEDFFSPKLVLKEVERIAAFKYGEFVLAYKNSSHYIWGKIDQSHWTKFKKLNFCSKSFAVIVSKFTSSPFTFGLTPTSDLTPTFGRTSTFYQLEEYKHLLCKSEESIRRLFNNPDNYDIEFIIGEQQQRIVASKCYLKSVSEYFRKMLSGEWRENDRIMIDSYSYDTYYSYLNMLHCGPKDSIKINAENIAEFTDLAHCYCDEKLIGYCKNFIRNDLNEQTLQIYLPLISKYQLDELNGKLRQIAHDKLFPEIQNNYQREIENSVQDFLQNYLEKRQSSSESIDSSNKKPKIE
ncbi:RCC1 and BTB domain-containing protein 1-like [Dermatophagoides pteronyssinus]|uniref:RCC1 and BTB domain-containing protein 1-like n=1 Tax=Dermatophagoides pteronyssinus TaxID=6956 RepID=UPI003F676DC9